MKCFLGTHGDFWTVLKRLMMGKLLFEKSYRLKFCYVFNTQAKDTIFTKKQNTNYHRITSYEFQCESLIFQICRNMLTFFHHCYSFIICFYFYLKSNESQIIWTLEPTTSQTFNLRDFISRPQTIICSFCVLLKAFSVLVM